MVHHHHHHRRHGHHHDEEVPPPTDNDILFGKADHPGTVQFHHICQGAVLQYPDSDYGTEIYSAIHRPIKKGQHRLFMYSKKRGQWILAGKKSRNRYFEKEFNRIKHKHLIVTEESDHHSQTEEHESDHSSTQHHEAAVDIEMGQTGTKTTLADKVIKANGQKVQEFSILAVVSKYKSWLVVFFVMALMLAGAVVAIVTAVNRYP